jgi:hypothetical protein
MKRSKPLLFVLLLLLSAFPVYLHDPGFIQQARAQSTGTSTARMVQEPNPLVANFSSNGNYTFTCRSTTVTFISPFHGLQSLIINGSWGSFNVTSGVWTNTTRTWQNFLSASLNVTQSWNCGFDRYELILNGTATAQTLPFFILGPLPLYNATAHSLTFNNTIAFDFSNATGNYLTPAVNAAFILTTLSIPQGSFYVDPTITLVQGNSRATATTGNTVTFSQTNAPAKGDLDILTAGFYDGGGNWIHITGVSQANVTWSYQQGWEYSEGDTAIWAGVASASAGASITVSLSYNLTLSPVSVVILDVCEWSGLRTIGFLDQMASNYNFNANTQTDTGTTPTTSQANELFLGTTFGWNGGSQSTPTNSFTLLDGVNTAVGSFDCSETYLYYVANTAMQADSGATLQGAADWWGCMATFEQAPAPSYSNAAVNTTLAGYHAEADVLWNTGTNVSGYVFGSNASSSWVNQTWTALTTMYNATAAWANYTGLMLPTSISNVQWEQWFNDSANTWTGTGLLNTTTSQRLAISFVNTTRSRIGKGTSFYINGTLCINGTTSAPPSGPMLYASVQGNTAGSTSSYNATTGNFNFSASAYGAVGNWTYTVYAANSQGPSVVNGTLYVVSDSYTIILNANTTSPSGGAPVLMNATATYAFDGSNVTTLGVNVARNGTSYTNSTSWTETESAGTTCNYTIISANDTAYGIDVWTSNTLTVAWGQTVVEVSGIYQTSNRTGINQPVGLSYRVIYGGNYSSVTSGSLTVNGTSYSISAGWCNFTVTNSSTRLVAYVASGSSLPNTVFSQVSVNPTVIFDEVSVMFSVTANNVVATQNVVISWTEVRLYDNSTIATYNMTVTVNGVSTYNVNQTASSITDAASGSTQRTYTAGSFVDAAYNITSFTSNSQTVSWISQGGGGGGGGQLYIPPSLQSVQTQLYVVAFRVVDANNDTLTGAVVIVFDFTTNATVIDLETGPGGTLQVALQAKSYYVRASYLGVDGPQLEYTVSGNNQTDTVMVPYLPSQGFALPSWVMQNYVYIIIAIIAAPLGLAAAAIQVQDWNRSRKHRSARVKKHDLNQILGIQSKRKRRSRKKEREEWEKLW